MKRILKWVKDHLSRWLDISEPTPWYPPEKDKPKESNNTFFIMKNTDKSVGIGSTFINVKTLFNLNNL